MDGSVQPRDIPCPSLDEEDSDGVALQVSGGQLKDAPRRPLELSVWPELCVEHHLQAALVSHDWGKAVGEFDMKWLRESHQRLFKWFTNSLW